MISILVLNPFSVLHLSFPLFLTSFILAPIVWLPETLFDTQSLKKNVFEVTSDQIFLQIFHFFSLVIPIYQLHRQSFFLCNSSFPIFCYNSKACTFVFQQKLSITSFHFSPFHQKKESQLFFLLFFLYVSARGTLKISKVTQSHYKCY